MNNSMYPIIPIALTRQAVTRMNAVKSGRLSHDTAKQELVKATRYHRSELIAHLTKNYTSDAKAFQFFNLL